MRLDVSSRKDWVKLVFRNNTVYEQRTTGYCKCLRKLNLNKITTESYVIFGRCQIRFRSGVGRCEASEWTWKVRSIFSHFVRRDTSHQSEAVSGIFGRYDHRILDNKTVHFFHKYFFI
jgi:hypothetical protein